MPTFYIHLAGAEEGELRMRYADIFVTGTTQDIIHVINQTFYHLEFHVYWNSPYHGKAIKGSKGANVVVGAIAQYYEFDFNFFTSPDNTIVIRIIYNENAFMGGIVGNKMVADKLHEIAHSLTSTFHSMGLYKGILIP